MPSELVQDFAEVATQVDNANIALGFCAITFVSICLLLRQVYNDGKLEKYNELRNFKNDMK